MGQRHTSQLAVHSRRRGLPFPSPIQGDHAADGRRVARIVGLTGGIHGGRLAVARRIRRKQGWGGRSQGHRRGESNQTLVRCHNLHIRPGYAIRNDGRDLPGGCVKNRGEYSVEGHAHSAQLRAHNPGAIRLELSPLHRAKPQAGEDHDLSRRNGSGKETAAADQAALGRSGGRRPKQADRIVTGIGHEDVTRRIQDQSPGQVQGRVGGRSAVVRVAAIPVPRNRGDIAVRGHLPDAVLARFGDVQVPGAVHGHSPRGAQQRVDRRSAIARESRLAPGNGSDDPGGGNLPDPPVCLVGDVEVAGRVERQCGRQIEQRVEGRSAVSRKALALPNHGVDGERGNIDFPNPVVEGVCDVEVPIRVEDYGARSMYGCGQRRPTISEETGIAIPRVGADRAIFKNLADPVVARIRYEKVAVGRDRDPHGLIQECRRGWPALAAKTRDTGAGDRGDRAVGGYLPHAVVRSVGEVEIARRIHRHPRRCIDLRVRGWSAVARKIVAPVSGKGAE